MIFKGLPITTIYLQSLDLNVFHFEYISGMYFDAMIQHTKAIWWENHALKSVHFR